MSAEMRANTIPNLLKKMIAHVATSAVFVHSVHFVHVKCIKVYEATVMRCFAFASCGLHEREEFTSPRWNDGFTPQADERPEYVTLARQCRTLS